MERENIVSANRGNLLMKPWCSIPIDVQKERDAHWHFTILANELEVVKFTFLLLFWLLLWFHTCRVTDTALV